MVTYLLKKSYQLKDLKQIEFQDLWGDHGIFTTMWIFGKPAKILFFGNHLKNLILSLKKYQIKKKSLKSDILKIINKNLSKKRKYNHLLRIAINKKIISISLRKRIKPKLNFNLKLVKLKEPFKLNNFEITMRCLNSKVAMAFENQKERIYGFQFHPESFLTINGNLLIKKILSA